jgi:uncharacterized protein
MGRVVSNPLRAGLAAALAVLLIAGLIVSQLGGRATSLQVADPPGGVQSGSSPATSTGRPGLTRSSIFGGPSSHPDPPAVRSQVTPGCGLSFDPEAAVVPPGNCTVLEVGDSIGTDLGWGLSRHLAPGSGLQLVAMDRTSTGLANTGFWDWPVALVTYIQEYHPQLVLICLGGNDQQGITAEGSGFAFGSPSWQSVYLARVQEMISAATQAGAYVVWVGLPVMQQPSFNRGVAYLDGLYARAVSGAQHAAFISTWSLLASAKGGYSSDAQVNGSRAGLRDADGVHLSDTGADVMGTYVIEQMASVLHVSLVAANPVTVTGRYG